MTGVQTCALPISPEEGEDVEVLGRQSPCVAEDAVGVAGAAALGGGVPFLLYAAIHDSSASSDEQLTGALSTAGLILGAYIGFRMTSDMDVDRDVIGHKTKPAQDAPPAVLGRSSDGRWGVGALTIQPLSRQLAPQAGMAVPLVGAAF